MSIDDLETTTGSPVEYQAFSNQKTARAEEPANKPVERTSDGTWHIRNYDLAREILLSSDTRQAGFKVELTEQMPGLKQKPVLFQDGPDHHSQRRQIARFFTPKTTQIQYQEMMESFSDELISSLQERKRGELSDITMAMAVRVASQVVGLTSSILPGMPARVNRFLEYDPESGTEFSWSPKQLSAFLKTNFAMFSFYTLDVKPAIQARKKNRQEDVISHLLDQNYSDAEILMECIAYGTAGMVATRQFILVATWHFLENPDLRDIYLAADLEERHRLLEEILRLEPVVANLFRRATADINLALNGERISISEGELVNLHIYGINADQSVVGLAPHAIIPGRPLEKRAQPPVMGFGFGHHRCPGAFIAIQESDIFLQRLLALSNLRLVSEPVIAYNDLIKGYEIRNFQVAVG